MADIRVLAEKIAHSIPEGTGMGDALAALGFVISTALHDAPIEAQVCWVAALAAALGCPIDAADLVPAQTPRSALN